MCPGDAKTHNGTRFLLLALSCYIGDPDVIPDHDYDRSSLLAVFMATLATLLVPILFSLQAIDSGDILLGSGKAHTHYWGGGGSSVEPLHFSHFHHVSLVQWTNCLLAATGGSASRGLLDISTC